MDQQNAIEWQAPEFTMTKKSPDWYWTLGIVVLTGVIVAFLLGNILLAIFIALGGFTVTLYANRRPRTVDFRITTKGIRIDTKRHPYNSFESFWIDDSNEQEPVLRLNPKKTLAHQTTIPLHDTDLNIVQDFLHNYLPEEEQGKPLVDRAMEFTKF